MNVLFFSRRKLPKEQSLIQFGRSVCRNLASLKGKGEICVIFVSDKKITGINQKFLKKNRPTDVIAFRYPTISSFGDIYISIDTARKQAKTGGHELAQELALLIAHGLLHLIGYEDRTAKDQKRMFAKQRDLFRKLAPRLAPPDFS